MTELSKEVGHVRGNDLIFSSEAFEKMNRIAHLMAEGAITTPKHLQGKPADCFAIVLQAMQWQLNPFVVAQKTHIINGILGYEAQLVNAIIQSSGLVNGEPEYEYRGDGEQLECRVAFIPAGKSELKWGHWLMKSSVTTRNSPLWKTNDKQQMGYLQVKNWARAFAPGAILGVYSTDELQDSVQPEKVINPSPNEAPVDTTNSLPPMDDAKFNSNFPTYQKGIESGKNTADQVIAKISSRYSLSQSQIDAINAVKPAINGELVDEA